MLQLRPLSRGRPPGNLANVVRSPTTQTNPLTLARDRVAPNGQRTIADAVTSLRRCSGQAREAQADRRASFNGARTAAHRARREGQGSLRTEDWKQFDFVEEIPTQTTRVASLVLAA